MFIAHMCGCFVNDTQFHQNNGIYMSTIDHGRARNSCSQPRAVFRTPPQVDLLVKFAYMFGLADMHGENICDVGTDADTARSGFMLHNRPYRAG